MRSCAAPFVVFFIKLSEMVKTRTLLVVLAALFFALVTGCHRTYSITERAKQQLPVSLEYGMSKYIYDFKDPEIEDLKVVYENDSICLLQFTAAYKDSANTTKRLDLRYIYLFDRFMSMAEGKPVFNEGFRNILCLPDQIIKESREEVKMNKEVVYNDFIGSTFPVKTPFDE